MVEETKITLKLGIIASLVGGLVMFIMTCLWNHQTDITILKADYKHVFKKLDTIENTVMEIRNDQLRREIREKKKNE